MNAEQIGRYLPWAVVVGAALFLLAAAVPSSDEANEPRLLDFARLPVVEGGRVKPIDSVARSNLMMISNRQTYTDKTDKTQPAIRWMLGAMTSQPIFGGKGAVREANVFRIENDELLGLLGLKPRDGFRYSVDDLAPTVDRLTERATRARKKDQKERDLVDTKALELAEHLERFVTLARLQAPHVIAPPEGDDWQVLGNALANWPEFEEAVRQAAAGKGNASSFGGILRDMRDAGHDDRPAVTSFGLMLDAYARDDAKAFNGELEKYQRRLEGERPADVRLARFEAFFNHFEPFYWLTGLYLAAGLLTAGSWLGFWEPLRRSGFWLLALLFVVHTLALAARVYLSGRPPVTNLYSSAIFIGWAGVLFGLGLELLFRLSIGNVIGAAVGFLTVLVAHNLATMGTGDTLGVMQAVLDTNFWLATHVICVTLGYATTFVAGTLGISLLVVGVATPALNRKVYRLLGQMIYGVVCFAMFFSFVGTVLGGIWADQSWGRFWGWDPKENGALLIVLMNALILHARWAGMVQQRGMAVLAVLGNIDTSWSWFGTNMLGVGLHAYGAMERADVVLWMYVFFNLGIAGGGMMPLTYWRSYTAISAR